ncbi:hypothetical protein Tco_0468597 [Tanacetum coccineum]
MLSEAHEVSLRITSGVRVRVIPGIVYHDLYLGGKDLVYRENMGLDLTKSDLCPSFVEDYPMKGVGLRVADSHTSNHCKCGFTPLETIQRFLEAKHFKCWPSFAGGLDPVSPVIRLPIECGNNSGTRIGTLSERVNNLFRLLD